jgi:hypothetical protein
VRPRTFSARSATASNLLLGDTANAVTHSQSGVPGRKRCDLPSGAEMTTVWPPGYMKEPSSAYCRQSPPAAPAAVRRPKTSLRNRAGRGRGGPLHLAAPARCRCQGGSTGRAKGPYHTKCGPLPPGPPIPYLGAMPTVVAMPARLRDALQQRCPALLGCCGCSVLLSTFSCRRADSSRL